MIGGEEMHPRADRAHPLEGHGGIFAAATLSIPLAGVTPENS